MAKQKKFLHDLDAAEISFVSKGAINRKFIVTKSADEDEEEDVEKMKKSAEEIQKAFVQKVRGMISKAGPDLMGKVDEHLKNWAFARGQQPAPAPVAPQEAKETNDLPLTDEASAAIKAVVRILTGFKDQLDPALLHEVLEIAGFQLGAGGDEVEEGEEGEGGEIQEEVEGEPTDDAVTEGDETDGEAEKGWDEMEEGEEGEEGEGGDVSKEHLAQAAGIANKAFKGHLEKMGYKKFPEAKMALKNVSKPKGGIVPSEGSADISRPEKGSNKKGETVTKQAETTVDLSQVDPKVREQVEMVFKSNAELVKKAADLEAAIKARDEKDRDAEMVQKAATWKNLGLPQDMLVAQLKDADKVGKDSFERICKSFDTLNAQAEKAGLFGEIGSSQGSQNLGTPDGVWEQITKCAEGIVKKSAGEKTLEQARDEFLCTSEGQKMYLDYKNAKGGI